MLFCNIRERTTRLWTARILSPYTYLLYLRWTRLFLLETIKPSTHWRSCFQVLVIRTRSIRLVHKENFWYFFCIITWKAKNKFSLLYYPALLMWGPKNVFFHCLVECHHCQELMAAAARSHLQNTIARFIECAKSEIIPRNKTLEKAYQQCYKTCASTVARRRSVWWTVIAENGVASVQPKSANFTT